MPFILVTTGLLMIITGARNTFGAFGKQLASDFTGPGNFTYWMLSVGTVGAVGYVPPLRKFSVMFMTLILLAMILAHGGFFEKFYASIRKGPIAPKAGEGTAQGGGAASGPWYQFGGTAAAPNAGQSTLSWAAGNVLEGQGAIGPTGDNMFSRFMDWASGPMKPGK